jgi:hypothetical protein
MRIRSKNPITDLYLLTHDSYITHVLPPFLKGAYGFTPGEDYVFFLNPDPTVTSPAYSALFPRTPPLQTFTLEQKHRGQHKNLIGGRSRD